MNVGDNLMLGPSSINLSKTGDANPTLQDGAGPMGRIFHYNIVPAAVATANIAALQHLVANVAMALAAGAGVTAVAAPDGSGATVYQFDWPRAVSLTSTANMSAYNITITGYDFYGQKMTQKRVGPNNNTVNTLKAFYSVLSVTSDTTDGANNLSVGSSSIMGLPYEAVDAGYVIPKWANALDIDAGTFVVADTTSPATNATGDVRGTYLPSSATDGAKRLVLWQHLAANQCGPTATLVNLIGVPQA